MISTIKAKNVIHVKNTIPFEVSLEELYEHTYHFDSVDEVRDYVLMLAEENNSNLEYKNIEVIPLSEISLYKGVAYNDDKELIKYIKNAV